MAPAPPDKFIPVFFLLHTAMKRCFQSPSTVFSSFSPSLSVLHSVGEQTKVEVGFLFPWGHLMPYMLSTIYQIILTTLTQGALQVLTSAVETVKIQRQKRQWIISETIGLLIFQRLHLRTSLKRSRCMFTGFVAQVEQPMRLTDETDRKEQLNVGWSFFIYIYIFFFFFLLQLLFFAMERVNRALTDSVSINRTTCFFLLPSHCQWTDLCSCLNSQ